MPSTLERLDQARTHLRKIAFESLYGPFAWAYDWVSKTFFMGQWRPWQRAAIRHLRGQRVLEVGMGTGNMQVDLARAGFEPYGVDLSAQMLWQATRKARAYATAPLRACRGRAQALPFVDGAFDSVLSTFPSEYITDPQTLAEIARVLRPGGRFVVVLGGWLHPRGAKGRAMEGVARVVYGYGSVPAKDEAKIETLEQLTRRDSGWHRWASTLEERMRTAGLDASAHVASNDKGACLIIVADKLQTSTSSSRPLDEANSGAV